MTGATTLRRSRWVFALLLAGYSVIYLARMWDLSVVVDGSRYFVVSDDTLISMRYAEHLAERKGLVWNPGEPAVEGYTNFAWVLWMALLHLLPLPKNLLPGVLQLSILALDLATLWLLRRFTWILLEGVDLRGRISAPAAANLAVVLLALSANFMGWSLSGLEVALLALATTGTLLAFYRVVVLGSDRSGIALVAWQTLGLLTRDDFVVVILGVWLAHAGREMVSCGGASGLSAAAADLRRRLPLVVLPVAAKLGHLAFRWAYYGDLLPNTYYAKLHRWPLGSRLEAGLLYALGEAWALKVFLALVLGAVLALAFALRSPALAAWRKGALPALCFCGGFLVVQALYIVWTGGDAFPQGRFAVPAYGVLFALVPLSWVVLVERLRVEPSAELLLAVVLAVVAVIGTPYLRHWHKGLDAVYVHDSWDAEWNIEYARFLARRDPDARVAVFWAGGVPYWSELPAVDLLGLNDLTIARGAYRGSTPGHGKYDFEHSLSRYRPDFVVGFDPPEGLDPRSAAGAWRLRELQETTPYPYVEDLFRSPSFLADYYDHAVSLPAEITMPGIRVYARGPVRRGGGSDADRASPAAESDASGGPPAGASHAQGRSG
ncbi:MAG TPA: hypothetical protein VMT16_09615 [Thermoanaerobaculia bacterium]|nr:hypothetical protein [Thermoanaerobaculia bacterium]